VNIFDKIYAWRNYYFCSTFWYFEYAKVSQMRDTSLHFRFRHVLVVEAKAQKFCALLNINAFAIKFRSPSNTEPLEVFYYLPTLQRQE